MQSHINEYIAKGYTVIQDAPSRIGSTILVNDSLHRVVKFSQDRAYHQFATYAQATPDPGLPQIHEHQEYDDDSFAVSNSWYTVTEMERLERLNADEASQVEAWIARLVEALKSGTPWDQLTDDPFQLLSMLRDLCNLAQTTKVGLDVLKASNYMVRASEAGRQLVITDPFN